MKKYEYGTDAEFGIVEANSLTEALDKVRPTAKQIEDGAWAWVEDPDHGGQRLSTRNGD